MLRSQMSQLTSSPDSSALMGTVVAVQANYYQVHVDPSTPVGGHEKTSDPDALDYLLCTRRARLKKIGQRVFVGDRVRIEEPDWQGKRGAIADVLPRVSELMRPPIANIDQIILVFALESPRLDPYQLSRFLVAAEMTGLPLHLCLTKADLTSPVVQTEWQAQLEAWGYSPLILSVETGQGVQSVLSTLTQRITVLTGPSGVGKSSLINHLIPDLHLRVSRVSSKLKRGRHTTRHVELFELPQGGFLADTPGFNLPDLATCSPAELSCYFPEIVSRQRDGQCQFSDCLHRDEPNCIVRGNWERYTHYLEFLQLIEQQPQYGESSEPNLKAKTKSAGQLTHEPRLDQKKFRRTSRKTRHQDLQALYQELQ